VARAKTTNEIKRSTRIELIKQLVRNGDYFSRSEEIAEALVRALDEIEYETIVNAR